MVQVLPRLGRLLGYSAEKDAWLDDFENGSRGEYPSALLAFGIPLFYAAGLLLETGIRLAFTGPADEASGFCCQLGVIGCIWAGVYEVNFFLPFPSSCLMVRQPCMQTVEILRVSSSALHAPLRFVGLRSAVLRPEMR